MTNIFEVAVRNKFRFNFKGSLTVEDLWDLKLSDLDAIFKALNAQARQAKEESLLDTKTAEDEVLTLKIEIIKHVVAVKREEAQKREDARKNAEQRKKIMELLERKKQANLENLSVEELQELLKNTK